MEDVTIWTFLIVCPLCFLGGFIDSIAGGGGLISLPAYLVAGVPSHNALGTNKLSSFIGTTVSIVKYFRQGYIDLKIGIIGCFFAIAGSSIGANLVLFIDGYLLKIILIVLLPITAVFVLANKGLNKERKELSFKITLLVTCIVAFIVGAYDGFYGPGTGTFIILLLTYFAHMKLEKANGISKAINWGSNIAATVTFLLNGVTFIALGLTAGVFGAVGNFLGSRLFINKGIKIVRPIMIIVLILLFAKIIFDMFY